MQEDDIATLDVPDGTVVPDKPPYGEGILATLKWGMDKNIPLQELPSESNWCQSGYKCYYGGVIPGHFKAKEAATNFVMSSMNNVKVSDNPNKPISTRLVIDRFFIILVDIRDSEDIKSHFFFYDGFEAAKNFGKASLPLKEFSLENAGEFRKPWQKINKVQMDMNIRELHEMFKNFSDKVKSQQLENEQHKNNCECGQDHDATEPAGHNEPSD